MARFYVQQRSNGRWGVYDAHKMGASRCRSSHDTEGRANYYRDLYNGLHEEKQATSARARE